MLKITMRVGFAAYREYLTQKLFWVFQEYKRKKKSMVGKEKMPFNDVWMHREHDLLRELRIVLCSWHMERSINLS